MEFRDIQGKSSEELQSILRELQSKLMQLRFDLAAKKVKDVSQIRKTKVTIARVLTALKTK